MVSTISKPAIATPITNQLVKTSLGTQLSCKTTSIQAFVPTMDSQPASNLPCEWKKCNNCGITGHFAKKCRKPKKPQRQSSKTPQRNANQIDNSSETSDDEESVNYSTSCQQLYGQVYDSNNNSDSDDYVAAISCDSAN